MEDLNLIPTEQSTVVDSVYRAAKETYPQGWTKTGNIRFVSPRAKRLVERYKTAYVELYGGRPPKNEFCLSMLIELAMPELGAKLDAMESVIADRIKARF